MRNLMIFALFFIQSCSSSGQLTKAMISDIRAAAERGDPVAQYYYADFYIRAYDAAPGINKDIREGMRWYRRSANQGYREAEYILGQYYYDGDVVPVNYTDAFPLLRRAALKGNAPAQLLVGYMYFEGEGVNQNREEALRFIRLAATSNIDAEFARYETWITRQSYEFAQKTSQQLLAVAHADGLYGLQKNNVNAYAWLLVSRLQRSAVNSDYQEIWADYEEDSETLYQQIGNELTSSQIATAQSLAKRCFDSNLRYCP